MKNRLYILAFLGLVCTFVFTGNTDAKSYTIPVIRVEVDIRPDGTVASFAIIRRTPEGEQKYKRWNAYKEGLKNAADHSVKADVLDKHFIYAIAFGLPKGDIKSIFTKCSDDEIAITGLYFTELSPTPLPI